ncbi:tyrosine-type recombinase/integrase [Nocardioides sp. ChNu-153]|uniref:tyrosine-type recombinase/integrase n=1 Tax=Nocardioides sp. ChNu-153 TaxID=2779364 RepID=UPI00264BA2B9|nr:tyrosine-type recombinase/integrase [Nocardioides sp. ChNu-153]MDN7120327.1 tyrosine-type recombinase/integrase [Nocardioides sp. ChNu-153]
MADATLIAPTQSTTHLYVAQFLARYSGGTRDLYGIRMRLFLGWCDQHGVDPITGITRPLLELYGRHLEEVRGNAPASVAGTLGTLRMFYRLLAVDGVIPTSPAEYVRTPKVWYDDVKIVGLSRIELGSFIATARTMSPNHAALATLLGLLGLRVSEACAVQIHDFQDYERDHRVLRVVGKGKKPATIPLPPPIFRALDAAAGDRDLGPLLHRLDGVTPLDRHSAARMTRAIAKKAGIRKPVHPHVLRHSFITAALDAGAPLRDVQIAARHSDPRITTRYDRARGNLDRHAVHIVAAYIAGAA